MVIEVPGEVAHDDLHRWFTLGQIKRLLALPCRVNMDSRTVLSCLPLAPAADGDDEETHRWLDTAAPPAPRLERIGLRALRGWRTDERVSSDDARGFSITGVRVRADCREVAGWDQPMVVATALGLVAFVTQRREDGLHVLVQACRGLGAVGGPLVGATVQRGAGSDLTATDDGSAFFEALVTSPPTGALRYDTVHAEEGGRFYHVKTVHRIVEIAPGEVIDCPPSHRWLSLPRLKRLVARGGVNIQARSLLACLHAIDDDGNEPA